MHLLLHFHLLLLLLLMVVELLGAARVMTGQTYRTRRTRRHLFHLLLPVLLRRIGAHSLLGYRTTVTLRYGRCPMIIISESHGMGRGVVIFIRSHIFWRVHRRVHRRNRSPRWCHSLRRGDYSIVPLVG
jgi:hypothetical protein